MSLLNGRAGEYGVGKSPGNENLQLEFEKFTMDVLTPSLEKLAYRLETRIQRECCKVMLNWQGIQQGFQAMPVQGSGDNPVIKAPVPSKKQADKFISNTSNDSTATSEMDVPSRASTPDGDSKSSVRKKAAWEVGQSVNVNLESSVNLMESEDKFIKIEEEELKKSGTGFKACLTSLLYSQYFELAVTLAIICNAFYIGFSTDYMARLKMQTLPAAFEVVELCFLCIFVSECSLRFMVKGFYLFRKRTPEGLDTPDRSWNIFDFLVVGAQAFEFVLRKADLDLRLHSKISVLRMLRLLRLLRVIRIVKVSQWVGDLRMIVYAIQRSLSLFFWAVVVLAVLIFMFGVYFAALTLEHRLALEERCSTGGVCDVETEKDLEFHFGNLYQTMFTLFKVVNGGVDWGDVAALLEGADKIFGECMLVFFVAFTSIAVMNVISGVFLDAAIDRAKKEKELFLVRTAKKVFERADNTHDGTISWEDFQTVMDDDDVEMFFAAVDLDLSQAKGLFDLMDLSGDGKVHHDDFLQGCLRLRGPAKALDLMHLSREVMHGFDAAQAASDRNFNSLQKNRAYIRQARDDRKQSPDSGERPQSIMQPPMQAQYSPGFAAGPQQYSNQIVSPSSGGATRMPTALERDGTFDLEVRADDVPITLPKVQGQIQEPNNMLAMQVVGMLLETLDQHVNERFNTLESSVATLMQVAEKSSIATQRHSDTIALLVQESRSKKVNPDPSSARGIFQSTESSYAFGRARNDLPRDPLDIDSIAPMLQNLSPRLQTESRI